MSNDTCCLRDAYRAAVGRTRAASAILEGAESDTPLFGQAVAHLSCYMRAEMEAGRSFMAAMEPLRPTNASSRQGRHGARRPGRAARP